jgi:hypothetical protein
MSAKMPGDGTSSQIQISDDAIKAALKGPQLTPLPKPNYTGNGTYGRVRACFVNGIDPNQEYLSQGPSDADLRRQAEQRQALQNTFDMEENPLFMIPMAARAWGANENQVSVLNKLSSGIGSTINGTYSTAGKIGYKPF